MADARGPGLPEGLVQDPGRLPANMLRIAGDVVNGETVTIGGRVYEAELVNTDTTDDTADGDFNNTTNPLVLVGAVAKYESTTFAVGRLIRVEDEIMRVSAVSGGNVTVIRGQSFTTIVAHANGQNILQGNGPAVAGNFLVGITALTNWVFGSALVAVLIEQDPDVNADNPDDFAVAIYPKTSDFTMALACSSTLSFAGSGWTHPTMSFGQEPTTKRVAMVHHVVNAAEEAVGYIYFPFPLDFVPTKILLARVTAGSPQGLDKDFTGFFNLSPSSNIVTVSPGGAVVLAEDDVITLIVSE